MRSGPPTQLPSTVRVVGRMVPRPTLWPMLMLSLASGEPNELNVTLSVSETWFLATGSALSAPAASLHILSRSMAIR